MNIFGTGFVYEVELVGPDGNVAWRDTVHNRIPQEGVDYMAGIIAGTTAVVNDWFVGVFEGDYTPSSTSSASEIATAIAESTAYDAAARPGWAGTYDGTERVTNAAARAEFVFNQDKRVYGAFLVSTASKLDTSGKLLSIARFSSPRDIENGSTLRVLAGIRMISNV